MSFLGHMVVSIALIFQGIFGGGTHGAPIQAASTPQPSLATTTAQDTSASEIPKTRQTVSVPKIVPVQATTSSTGSNPVITQPASISSDEQAAIDFYINMQRATICTEQSLLTVLRMHTITFLLLTLQQQADKEAAAAKAAASAAANAKAKQEADAAALAALKAQIAANPVTCSYTAAGYLYCNNLNSLVFNLESVTFTVLVNTAITQNLPIGYLYPVQLTDASNIFIWTGKVQDREQKTVAISNSLPANKSATSTNDRLVLRIANYCPNPDYTSIGCYEKTDFKVVVNSVMGRFSDGREFTPAIQAK